MKKRVALARAIIRDSENDKAEQVCILMLGLHVHSATVCFRTGILHLPMHSACVISDSICRLDLLVPVQEMACILMLVASGFATQGLTVTIFSLLFVG